MIYFLIRLNANSKIKCNFLKDLGKKWFAFSKMDIKSVGILERLGEK